MSVDVSPDGKTILFDMAGHLYTVSVEGGAAAPITSVSSSTASPGILRMDAGLFS